MSPAWTQRLQRLLVTTAYLRTPDSSSCRTDLCSVSHAGQVSVTPFTSQVGQSHHSCVQIHKNVSNLRICPDIYLCTLIHNLITTDGEPNIADYFFIAEPRL